MHSILGGKKHISIFQFPISTGSYRQQKNNNISLRVCVAVFCGYVCWVFVTHKWDDIQLNTIARANEAPVRAILYELLSCCFYSIPPGGREKV